MVARFRASDRGDMVSSQGWTQEDLLDEALALIDKIDTEKDPAIIKQLDGCFMAVQETMQAKHEAATAGLLDVQVLALTETKENE